MTIRPVPEPCFRCKNFLATGASPVFSEEGTQPMVCRAFRRGIPAAIDEGSNPHTSPFPGDNGIQFEPIQGA